MGRRIDLVAGYPFERGQEVRFQFEKNTIPGFDREPLAAALLASGVTVFGRSIKYHRPRGPSCMRANCSGCLMRVDGVPNIRTCETMCRSGAEVERQSGWPGSDCDIYRTVDWLTPKTLKHHSMFTQNAVVNRAVLHAVRSLSGLGKAPGDDTAKRYAEEARYEKLTADVVVVGAGVSGMTAASAMAGEGLHVVLLERDELPGGRLLDGASRLELENGKTISGWEALREINRVRNATASIDIYSKTTAVAVFSHQKLQVLACAQNHCLEIQPERLVICTGAYEQGLLFTNNDLPGIFGLRALDRLVYRYGVIPAEPVVLFGNSDQTLRLALTLADRGVDLEGVVTDLKEGELVCELEKKKVPLFGGLKLIRARGRKGLHKLEFDSGLLLSCRACSIEAPGGPAYELSHHAGCSVAFRSDSGFMVATDSEGRTSQPRIFAAGQCTGETSISKARQGGERAGLACARSIKSARTRTSSSG